MSERFIKFIPSEEAMWLLKNKGHAFRLLTIIAESARRESGNVDGLEIGEALIGDWKSYDMSEQNYRTAKDILVKRQHLKIVETNRTRKKSTTGITTEGTKVKILSLNVYDININIDNDRVNDCPTTAQRLPNDEQEDINTDKKIDHDLIDAREPAFDLIFKHKKQGKIGINRNFLIAEMQKDDDSEEEVTLAINQMVKQNPVLNGTIQAYLKTILITNKEKSCQKKKFQQSNNSISKPKCLKDKGFYLDGDTSEAPLAKLARQTGLK